MKKKEKENDFYKGFYWGKFMVLRRHNKKFQKRKCYKCLSKTGIKCLNREENLV